MTPNFFQAATLKKIWVEVTLKKSQVATYKNLGKYPSNHFSGVQIKRASIRKQSLTTLITLVIFAKKYFSNLNAKCLNLPDGS